MAAMTTQLGGAPTGSYDGFGTSYEGLCEQPEYEYGPLGTLGSSEQPAALRLTVVVDVAAGVAQVVDGDATVAAGLEVICHGRRMVVTAPQGYAAPRRQGRPAPSRGGPRPLKAPSPRGIKELGSLPRGTQAVPQGWASDTLRLPQHGLSQHSGRALSGTMPTSAPLTMPGREMLSPPLSPVGHGITGNHGNMGHHRRNNAAHGRIVHQAINILLDDDD